MDGRGTICAHCARDEAEEPCGRCLRAVCISCLLDRVPCRVEFAAARHGDGRSSREAAAIATLASCGLDVAMGRLVEVDVPLWLIDRVRVGPLGDPRPGQPDVWALTVGLRSGADVELLRRADGDGDELQAAAAALAELAHAAVSES